MQVAPKILDSHVAAVFQNYPSDIRNKLLALRSLIFDLASELYGKESVVENLKWGQPSYRTVSGKGTPLRIDQLKKQPEKYALYFNCQTTLAESFRELYPGKFEFEGTRAIVFQIDKELPVEELSHCISLALTYHLKK